jgi:hypothetical protein
MTKKRLSDLLKEEVTKAEAPSPEGAPQAGAEAIDSAPTPTRQAASSRRSVSGRASSTKTKSSAASKAKTKAAPVATPEPPAPEPAAQATPEINPGQRLADLEKALAAAQKDNTRLEKTVAGLQSDLETQQSHLFELKDSLAKAEATAQAKDRALTKAQAELEEAKQTILKLSEAATPPVPKVTPHRISGVDILPRRPVEVKEKPTYRRGVPEYAIQKGQPNPMLSDVDIGWVD